MMSYFIFNDYNSSRDLIITKPFQRPSWAKEYTETATGSPSKVIQFSRSFGNAELEIETVIKNTSAENMNRIFAKIQGYGRLILSNDSDVFMRAVVNPLAPVAVSQHMAEMKINFLLLPFAYAITSTKTTFGRTFTRLINRGSAPSEPLIKFTSVSAENAFFNINGSPFTVRIDDELVGREIVIDSELTDTYYIENGQKVSVNHCTFGEYPLLASGEVFLLYDADISGLEIDMRERWF